MIPVHFRMRVKYNNFGTDCDSCTLGAESAAGVASLVAAVASRDIVKFWKFRVQYICTNHSYCLKWSNFHVSLWCLSISTQEGFTHWYPFGIWRLVSLKHSPYTGVHITIRNSFPFPVMRNQWSKSAVHLLNAFKHPKHQNTPKRRKNTKVSTWNLEII